MKTNILLAIRNILKNRVNSVITLLGLSIAFACLFLIFLYVSQETSYNTFHKNGDCLFRVNYSVGFADGKRQLTVLLDPKLSEVIKDKVPQVKKSTAFRKAHNPALKFENHNLEADLCITEPDFFSMFSFKLVIGNKDELFKNPDEIVISRSLASKFQAISACTTETLIGKSVFFANTGDQPFVISGIIEDIPKNSSLQFEALIPYKYEDKFNKSSNMFGNSTIFYETDKADDAHLAEVQVIKTIQEYNKGLIEKLQSQKVIAGNADCFLPFVLSFKDVYLGKVYSDDERSNNWSNLYILSAIGLLILLIACSNFVLLSLGQSLKKIGEVGIRKVMGAKNGSIFRLFFTENILLTLVALVLGCCLCFILLPVFNRLSQNEIYTELIGIPRLFIFSIACILLIVTTTSMVPVLKLVKIRPGMLASKSKERKSNITNLFVTLQYGLSIFLIILTIFILRQTNYMKNSDLGLSSENIINLKVYHLNISEKLALKEKLIKNPGIVNLTFTDRNYVSGTSGEFVTRPQGENIATRILRIDQNYIPTLGLKLIQGRNFEEENLKEGDKAVIINEELLGRLGFTGEAVGQTITMNGKDLQIIGVVKDFHFDSMKDRIEPLIFCTNVGQKYRYIFVKCGSSQFAGIIPFIKETWSKTVPDKELDMQFWDEQLAQRYQSEDRWGKIILYAAFIAILLSSLGLFGFTVLEINKRVKEVGIRKVSGATISEVLVMLNRDFVKWVAIAFVIATPVAYYAMHKWLENFAYKTELNWWIFALAGLLALGIALLTVSWQSWKAATRNPVEALRYE